MPSFSKKHGYGPTEKPITTREAAPQELREFILQAAYDTGFSPKSARAVVCRTLRKAPDRDNWTEFPNIDNEIRDLVESCDWYKVYDIIESFAAITLKPKQFETEVNDYFKSEGIGWQLENGEIRYRGDEVFEAELRKAEEVLEDASLKTAANELREAISDLSRRPDADITGAIQHSLACLECTAREASGGSKETIGPVMKKNPGLVPAPLDAVVEKIYGFGSNQGRHLQEGKAPSFEEAELLVGLSAALSTYIGRKFKPSTDTSAPADDENDLPF
jgi:hypothetical protein